MRTLLFGVILGLLAVVYSTPVYNVTQSPAKAEYEVIREAATEGFLVENLSLPSGTTGSPTTGSATNLTVQATQRPATNSTEGVAIEGSGGETIDDTTTAVSLQFGTSSASQAPSTTSTMSPNETADSSSVSFSTQSPPSGSSSVPSEAQPSTTPDRISAWQTTDPAVSTFGFLSTQGSDSGSGDGEMFGPYFTTTTRSSMTSGAETSAASSTSTASPMGPVVFPGSEGSASGSGEGLEAELDSLPITTEMKNRQRMLVPNDVQHESKPSVAEGTPGWMIIVGFIVGLAALVMLFVAIATRDKWNGPSRASMLAKTNSSNQQREVEMETFLEKDKPKENGHGSEYTVIPLEELPEKYSSH
ncbi:uncharacterized protein DDB_G0284671-like [Clinocottus analis]|uniref:uncharacterized protein DDB_G0284671-like n=1 Tax=Clinocottus analis TaxID=304258 RepID=UPI0035BFA6B8